MTAELKIVDLAEGQSLAFAEQGEGPPIVLVHGAMVTHQDWFEEPISQISRRGRTIAIDRPGHGASLRLRYDASPMAQARQVRRGLELAGISRPLMVAHSFGGLLALAYAQLFPDEIAGLVLVSPVAFPEFRPTEHVLLAPRAAPFVGPLLSQVAQISDPAVLQVMQRAMFAPQSVPKPWRSRFPYDAILSQEQMVAEGEDAAAISPMSPEAWVDLDQVRTPVRIVAGTMDLVADPNRHARLLARRLPQSRLNLMPGFGHMIHHCALDAVLEALDDLQAASQEAEPRPKFNKGC